ncbi:hypothetical protein BH24ACT12_BH24ACT12_22650 [soil metagenome]
MAYDEDLADHIREAIHDQDGRDRDADVRRLAVLVDGNMAVSASGQGGLLLWVDPGEVRGLAPGCQPHV